MATHKLKKRLVDPSLRPLVAARDLPELKQKPGGAFRHLPGKLSNFHLPASYDLDRDWFYKA